MGKPFTPASVSKPLPCTLPDTSFFKLSEPYGHIRPFRRFLSLMRKKQALSMVVEQLDPASGELGEEDAFIKETMGLAKLPDSEVERYSFFSTPHEQLDIASAPSEALVGYAVVKKSSYDDKLLLGFPHVYEAVVRPEPLLNNYFHAARILPTAIADKDFEILGCLFAQQNAGVTCRCAHVALRMLLSAVYPSRRVTYREIVAAAQQEPLFAEIAKGLDEDTMLRVLAKFSVETVRSGGGVTQLTQNQKVVFEDTVYSALESGYPALLGFPTEGDEGHVVTAVGHTINSDLWEPHAKYAYYQVPDAYPHYSSAAWADYFLVNDDNFGMYLTLGTQSLRHNPQPTPIAIATVPSQPRSMPWVAESWCCIYLSSEFSKWYEIFREVGVVHEDCLRWMKELTLTSPGAAAAATQLVLRILLISRDEYIRHLVDISDPTGHKLDPEACAALKDVLPASFWMCEFSLTDLFTANRRKLGEVLMSSTDVVETAGLDPAYCSPKILLLRLPGVAVLNPVEKPEAAVSEISGHTPLFRGHALMPRQEW